MTCWAARTVAVGHAASDARPAVVGRSALGTVPPSSTASNVSARAQRGKPDEVEEYREGVIEVDVLGVRVEMPTNQPIVLLRERTGARHLPIWIGAAEATAIAYAQQGVVPPRPLTHDLLRDVLDALGQRLTRVRVDELKDKVFYATLEVGEIEISARPSDAIALALRTGSPILVAEQVFDDAGIVVAPEEDDEVERFREFLDQITPEDFDDLEPRGEQDSTSS